jgi:hypothetical protein
VHIKKIENSPLLLLAVMMAAMAAELYFLGKYHSG